MKKYGILTGKSWWLGNVLKLALLVVSTGLLSSCASMNPLMHASEEGNIVKVNALLARGVDANAKDKNGATALMLAAGGGHTETARMLLSHGADANAKSNYGWTPLMMASENGHSEIVKALLAEGADANAAMENGGTALMHAARVGDVEIVQALLRHGAHVSAKTRDGWTALMYAAGANANVVKLLIENGADVSVRSIDFDSAWLDYSISGGSNPFYQVDRYSKTPLSIAKKYNKAEIIQLLKGAKTRINDEHSQKTEALPNNNEEITIDTNFFENLGEKSWSTIRKLDKIDVRDIIVPSVVKSDVMRVESVPGGAAERQNVESQIGTLCKLAGYQLSAQSQLYITVEYSELLAIAGGKLIMAPGTGTIGINPSGSGQTGKQISVNVDIHHEQYGVIRRIKIESMHVPFSHLAKLWPFARKVEHFIGLLEEGSPSMRRSAARTLGTVYADVAKSAIPSLNRLSEEVTHWRVRRAADIALQRIRKASNLNGESE